MGHGYPRTPRKGTTSLCCQCPATAICYASLSQAQRSRGLPEVTDQIPTNFTQLCKPKRSVNILLALDKHKRKIRNRNKMTRASLHLQNGSFGAASYQTSHLLRLAVQEHSAAGWRCVSFNAQIMAPYKLTASMTLKAFLTETFLFTSISFTDYKWLPTPDSVLS